MAVTKQCIHGVAIERCRCMEGHGPASVGPCPPACEHGVVHGPIEDIARGILAAGIGSEALLNQAQSILDRSNKA